MENPGVEEDPEVEEDEQLEVEEGGGLEVFDKTDPDGAPSSDQNTDIVQRVQRKCERKKVTLRNLTRRKFRQKKRNNKKLKKCQIQKFLGTKKMLLLG